MLQNRVLKGIAKKKIANLIMGQNKIKYLNHAHRKE